MKLHWDKPHPGAIHMAREGQFLCRVRLGSNPACKEGNALESRQPKPTKETSSVALAAADGDCAVGVRHANVRHPQGVGPIGPPAGCAARPGRIKFPSAVAARASAAADSATSPHSAPVEHATAVDRGAASDHASAGRTDPTAGKARLPAISTFARRLHPARQRQPGGPVFRRPRQVRQTGFQS